MYTPTFSYTDIFSSRWFGNLVGVTVVEAQAPIRDLELAFFVRQQPPVVFPNFRIRRQVCRNDAYLALPCMAASTYIATVERTDMGGGVDYVQDITETHPVWPSAETRAAQHKAVDYTTRRPFEMIARIPFTIHMNFRSYPSEVAIQQPNGLEEWWFPIQPPPLPAAAPPAMPMRPALAAPDRPVPANQGGARAMPMRPALAAPDRPVPANQGGARAMPMRPPPAEAAGPSGCNRFVPHAASTPAARSDSSNSSSPRRPPSSGSPFHEETASTNSPPYASSHHGEETSASDIAEPGPHSVPASPMSAERTDTDSSSL